MSFPVFPVHSISKGGMTSTKISTIKIWAVTILVPPGSFELNGAVETSMIIITFNIILISGGEWHTAMYSKRVTRIPWKNEPHYEYYV